MGERDELLVAVEESNRLLGELLLALRTSPRLMSNQAEAAERLGVSEKTIATLRKAGVLRESSLFPGRVLFSEKYLDRVLAEHDGDAPQLRRAS